MIKSPSAARNSTVRITSLRSSAFILKNCARTNETSIFQGAMTDEEYSKGFARACLFPYYGTPDTVHKDIYTSYNSLIQKLQHMYDRQLNKQERLRLTLLYLAYADPAHIESAKHVYVRLSESEILMFENKESARHSLLINAQSLENHACSLKFTTPGYFFSEHGYTNIVTERTFNYKHILPLAAICVYAVWRSRT